MQRSALVLATRARLGANLIRRHCEFRARVPTFVDDLDFIRFIGFVEHLNDCASRAACEPTLRMSSVSSTICESSYVGPRRYSLPSSSVECTRLRKVGRAFAGGALHCQDEARRAQ